MNKIDRREFIIAAVCTAAGCADIGAGEKQIAHFGMATDMHYADLPNAVDDPGERCYRDAPAKLRGRLQGHDADEGGHAQMP